MKQKETKLQMEKETTEISNRPHLKLEDQKDGIRSSTAGENRRLYIDAVKLNQTKECICTASASALQRHLRNTPKRGFKNKTLSHFHVHFYTNIKTCNTIGWDYT